MLRSVFISVSVSLIGILLYAGWQVATTPWLVWLAGQQSLTESHVLLNTSVLPANLVAEELIPGVPVEAVTTQDRLRQVPQTLSWPAIQSIIRLVWQRAPLQPVIIGSAPSGSIPLISEPFFFIASLHKDELRIGFGSTMPAALKQLQIRAMPVTAPDTKLAITMPGTTIASLPASLQKQLNDTISRRLRLNHTTPDILEFTSQFEYVALRATKTDTAIGIIGDAALFSTIAEQWLQEDDQQQRPQERSFRLPDGSLGKETIPGEVRSVLSPTHDGCRAPLTDRARQWLCQDDTQSTLGTSSALAQTLIDKGWPWSISAAPDQFSLFECTDHTSLLLNLACHSSHITIAGTGNDATATIQLK